MTPTYRRPPSGTFVRRLEGESVVHVSSTDTWHHLDALASAVLDAVDGRRDARAVADDVGVDLDRAEAVLARLALEGILQAPGLDRRQLVQRAALVGGAAVLASMVSPLPASAASPTTPGTRYSLRSTTPGEETLYLSGKADASAAQMLSLTSASSLQNRQLATFTVVAGLTGAAGSIAFQSVFNPLWYLRHAGRVIYVQTGSGTVFQQDATYVPVTGLSGTGTSLRSTTTGYTDQYIRRDGTAVFIRLPTEAPTATFARDASFFISAPLAPLGGL